MSVPTEIEQDADRRLAELIRVHTVLWPDRDDPAVLSELTSIRHAMLQLKRERNPWRQATSQ